MIMNSFNLEYKIKTASPQSIIEHLKSCADCFNPPLYRYVEIEKYGEKIYDNAVTFESWDGQTLVGLAAVYFNNLETKAGYITNMSVLKEYQGLGIASRLLKEVVEYGKQKSFLSIDLEVNSRNTKARELYKRYGFVVTENKNDNIVKERMTLGDSDCRHDVSQQKSR